MLLSRHTCLKGAFNHSHIFVDPHPDPSLSYDERERLFNLPSSTWADYNTALLSRGGGIFKRSDKTLLLSAEIRHMLDIPKNLMTITPDSLIVYLLKAPVDLLWFGGIGTYIKASYESHFDVHDTSNDAIRVDGLDIRARVIVEGANLGITQKGRIECAHTGVHLNTDAIDNSGGVDCSDHEVNIKILFSDLMRSGALTRDERNTMLVDMTGDIAERVLENNRQQNKVLTYLEQTSAESINAYGDLVHFLEKDTDALLNRTLESIPTDEEFKRRHDQHKGMTRPELAVLMAYSKILLYRKLVPVVEKHQDHPLIHTVLCNYFPALLTHQYRDAILRHHLRCEIVATVLSNRFINHLGPIDALAYVRENKHALWHRIQTYCTLTSAFH
jgi:glutamate dehydrogenase